MLKLYSSTHIQIDNKRNRMIRYNDPAQNPWLDLINFNKAYVMAQETPFTNLCQEIEVHIQSNAHQLDKLPQNQLFTAVLNIVMLLYKGANTLIDDKLFSDEKQTKYLETIIRNIWQVSNYLKQYSDAYQKLMASTAGHMDISQTKQLKYAFVFNATYELKTAHSIINMYSRLMQNKTDLTQTQAEAMEQLREGLERLGMFIDQANEFVQKKSKLPPSSVA